jgi:hypothetical protein
MHRYRSKNRKLNIRTNTNQTESKSEKNNKSFNKQNDDLTSYHPGKAYDRESEYSTYSSLIYSSANVHI